MTHSPWLLTLSLRFNSHFPGEPGLAGVYWSKGWRRWWWQLDYWSYKSYKAPVKSSPPTYSFFTGRMPFQSPNQQCQSTEGKISYYMYLLTTSSPGVFQLCLSPLIAPVYLGGGLPCLSSALWCQYPYCYIVYIERAPKLRSFAVCGCMLSKGMHRFCAYCIPIMVALPQHRLPAEIRQ